MTDNLKMTHNKIYSANISRNMGKNSTVEILFTNSADEIIPP